MLRRAIKTVNPTTNRVVTHIHPHRTGHLTGSALVHSHSSSLSKSAAAIPSQQLYHRNEDRRSFAAAAATSREKRALNEQQIGTAKPTAGSPDGGGGSDSGATTAAMVAVLAAAGGGAYYYFQQEEPVSVVVEKDVVSTKESDGETKEEVVVVEETVSRGEVKDAAAVVASEEPETVKSDSSSAPEDSSPSSSSSSEPSDEGVSVAAVTPVVATQSGATLEESKIMETLKELKAQIHAKSDKALTEAHQELAKLSSLNMNDLETMTETQLKVRLVQMAKDMEEQAKWEAVRLQEFLSLKEKEVEDKYLLMIKKLRREAEDLTDEKLAKQRKELQAEAEEALKEQQASSDAFVESSLKIQDQQYEEEKVAFEQKVEEAMSAKYEELFGKSMAEAKQEMAVKMDQKVKQMEALSKKLSDLEFVLQSTKDFQAGSVQAHRITAAAIALSEKLESGEPAGAAVGALKAVATDNVVVSSAVDSLPESISTIGLSTLQELQTSFEEEVYPQCRRASNIPDGQSGLEGQILGAVLTTLKYPPEPDDPAPESEKDASEYVLARARRHVQLGELEDAANEITKLHGQVAFVAKDWEGRAKDRVAVDKALKVIRMELALQNESLSKSTVL